MHLWNAIRRTVCVALLGVNLAILSGCAVQQLSNSNLERVEGRLYSGAGGRRGVAQTQILTWADKRLVQEIVIHAAGEVQNLDVYVSAGEGRWKRIKQIKGRSKSPIELRTAELANGVRVVKKSSNGYLRDIEVFAYAR